MDIIKKDNFFLDKIGFVNYYWKTKLNFDLLQIFYDNFNKYNNYELYDYIIDYEWFRILNKDKELKLIKDLDNIFRLYLNPKRSKLIEVLSYVYNLFYNNTFDILSIKVYNKEYEDNKMPKDEGDIYLDNPIIVIFLSLDKTNFENIKTHIYEKFDPDIYADKNVNLGNKRKKLNNFLYWSDNTTTKLQINKGGYYNKYLKYKFKYLKLKKMKLL